MIQRLENGRFKVTVNRGSGAQRQRVCRTVDTQAEAEQLETYLASRPADADGVTVLGAVDRYLTLHGPRLAPQSLTAYRGSRDRYIAASWIGAVRLDVLTWQQLEQFYAQMLAGTHKAHAKPLAVGTVRSCKRVIVAALNDALRHGWVKAEQYREARIVAPKVEQADSDDDDVLQQFADVGRVVASGGREVADLVQLAIATGARQGELAAIRWRDIDLATGVVRIGASISKGREEDRTPGNQAWHRKATKTGGRRRVRVDASTVQMLQARYARQWQQAQVAGVTSLDDRIVLSRLLEVDYTSPAALGLLWHRASRAAGVTSVRFHDLRHLNTSAMLDADVPLLDVQRRNGWTSPDMPLKVYGHALGAAHDDRALEALAGAWALVTDQPQPTAETPQPTE